MRPTARIERQDGGGGNNASLCLGATGFGLIAICYGFARFAFGLFLPQIDADLSLGDSLSGAISGGSFLSFCIAIGVAAYLTERIGARAVAIMAALVASVAMVGIATAPSALWLAGAVMLAGSSTGLASPPMAAAIATAVQPERQDLTNTIVNSGTSAGVAISGPIALALGGQWRLGFAIFAVMALAMAVIAAFSMSGVTATRRQSSSLPRLTGSLARLIVASLLAGASSTALWSFGAKLAALRQGWDSTDIGLLWMAIGGGAASLAHGQVRQSGGSASIASTGAAWPPWPPASWRSDPRSPRLPRRLLAARFSARPTSR